MAKKPVEINEQQILDDYLKKEMTQNEIGKKYGINVAVIRQVLRSNNIDTRLNAKTHDDVEEKIYEKILEYKKISEISEELDVTRDVVRRVAANHGIDIVQYRNEHYEKLIIEKLENGETYAQIVDELPISMDFLKKVMEKNDVVTPMQKKAKMVKVLRDKGYGIVKISQELKMSTRTVHKILDGGSYSHRC